MRTFLAILIAVSCTATLAAQTLNFVGTLPAYSQTGTISRRLDYNLLFYSIVRTTGQTVEGVNYPAQTLQLFGLAGLTYKLNRHLNVGTGYVHQRTNPFADNFVREHRLWQQVVAAHRLGMQGKLTHRGRLEERFIENRITEKYPLRSRFRYLLDYSLPLNGRRMETHEFYFHTYNEFWFNLSRSRNAFFEEDWLYAGIGYDTGKTGKVEFGPMYQTQIRNPQHNHRNLYLLQVMWSTHLNWMRK